MTMEEEVRRRFRRQRREGFHERGKRHRIRLRRRNGSLRRRLAEGPTKRLRCGVSGPPSRVPRLLEEREEEGDEGAETARSRETESVSLSVMRLLAADHNWRVIGHSSGHGHHRAEIDSGSDRFKLRPIGVHFREAKLVPKSGAGFGTRLRLVRPESLRFPPNTGGWRK